MGFRVIADRRRIVFNNVIFTALALWGLSGGFGLYQSGNAFAREPGCDLKSKDVQVSLDIVQGQVDYDFSKSIFQIGKLTTEKGGRPAPPRWISTGLTTTVLGLNLGTSIRWIPISPGRYCAALDKVEAELGHEEFKVYVAREYEPGTCEHRTILQHEARHVAVFKDVLRRGTQTIRARLEASARGQKALIVSDPETAAQAFQDRIWSEIEPLYYQLRDQQAKENAKLDTPENYMREQRACPGWQSG